MSNGDTFRNVLGEHKILNVVFQRFKNALMREEGSGHSRWHDRMNPGFPFTDPRSLFFICHVIDLCQRWTTEWHKWNANGCWSAYMCRPEASRRGELVPRTWADFLNELRGIVQMGGFATNLEATFRDLARAVLCLVGWLQGDPECNQTGETVRRFVHLVAQALRVPPLIAPVPQPRRVENVGAAGRRGRAAGRRGRAAGRRGRAAGRRGRAAGRRGRAAGIVIFYMPMMGRRTFLKSAVDECRAIGE